jgi:hypothetical protein
VVFVLFLVRYIRFYYEGDGEHEKLAAKGCVTELGNDAKGEEA